MRRFLPLFLLACLLAEGLGAQAIRRLAGFQKESIPANDDGSSALVQLPFTINFFGRLRSSGYVNNNGNITFDAALATFTPFGLENTRREIIAAFFADVDTRNERSAIPQPTLKRCPTALKEGGSPICGRKSRFAKGIVGLREAENGV